MRAKVLGMSIVSKQVCDMFVQGRRRGTVTMDTGLTIISEFGTHSGVFSICDCFTWQLTHVSCVCSPLQKPFDGANYNANGNAYVMERKVADVYAKPYLESPAASAAINSTMEKVDFNKLLKKVGGSRHWYKL